MKDQRLIRIPYAEFQRAQNVQSMFLKEGKRIPLWQCLLHSNNQAPSYQDHFRRIRL